MHSDSCPHSFPNAVLQALQLSIILTLLSLQLTFCFQRGMFSLRSPAFWYGSWTLAIKKISRKQLLESLGSWHQQQQDMDFFFFFFKVRTYPYYREHCSIQNAAIAFVRYSDTHQHNNAKLHIKNWFLVFTKMHICTLTLTYRKKERKKVLSYMAREKSK